MTSSADARAARIQVIVFDVDGVLTRGDITYGPGGEWKTFDVQDGHGIVLARHAGLRIAFLTARESEPVRRRAAELQVDALLEGRRNKGRALRELMANLRVKASEVCYVGDDLVDLPAMADAGLPVAVANAAHEVKVAAALVTTKAGGYGAAREVIEYVLKAKGRWDAIVQRYREDEG